MANRFYIAPGIIRVSQPGINAKSPPDETEDSLIFSSNWEKTFSLHAIVTFSMASYTYFGAQVDHNIPLLVLNEAAFIELYFSRNTDSRIVKKIPWSYTYIPGLGGGTGTKDAVTASLVPASPGPGYDKVRISGIMDNPAIYQTWSGFPTNFTGQALVFSK